MREFSVISSLLVKFLKKFYLIGYILRNKSKGRVTSVSLPIKIGVKICMI